MLSYGIDVSSINSATTTELPGDFAFIKATEGHTYTNPDQQAQAAAARQSGKVVGFYHFLWPGNIQQQAEYFVTQCASVPGDILACDWETCEDGSAATGAEKDAFLAAVKQLRPTHKVVLYCNKDFWFNRDTTSGCADGLWIADPGAAAGNPGIQHPWTFHQYATTAGIDRDVYNGSPAALRQWAGTPGGSGGGTYTVQSGDTLSGIAAAHHVSLSALVAANPQISDPNAIWPGQVIHLP